MLDNQNDHYSQNDQYRMVKMTI